MKYYLKSKTILFNTAMILLYLFTMAMELAPAVDMLVSDEVYKLYQAITLGGNTVLRFITTQPITLKKKEVTK